MAQLVWLITGCSSGFGEVFVRQLLARGDLVVATARRLERIQHLQDAGAAVLQLDVTDNQQKIREVVSEAISIHGRIDVLVNNAGYIATGAWEDLEYEQFLAEFDTNVFGAIKVTRALLPHFRQAKAGTNVFISSRSGWIGDPFCSAYSGSKFALEGLVEGLWKETQQFGIKTLLVEPGRFRTKFLSDGNKKAIVSKIPDYTEGSKALLEILEREDLAQPGDPEKGITVIIDVVRGEGCAVGREIPFRLPLGADCYEAIKEKCQDTLKLLEEWQQIIRGTDYS
ncbi:NAD(P)-binding protein [Thozetella sp. PMI_491]|nr:NAD(P)-binding protein [Thozetella sp. PMI_491]